MGWMKHDRWDMDSIYGNNGAKTSFQRKFVEDKKKSWIFRESAKNILLGMIYSFAILATTTMYIVCTGIAIKILLDILPKYL